MPNVLVSDNDHRYTSRRSVEVPSTSRQAAAFC